MIGQLSDQEEARMLLQRLEGKNVHVAVDEEYILDAAGNRIDRVIRCIAWWTQEQIRQAHRFVSDMVAEEFGGYIDSSDDDSIPQGQLHQELDSAMSENAEPSENEELCDQEIEAKQSDSSSDFLDIDKLVSQRATSSAPTSTATATTSIRPQRARKASAKQASQNRRAVEKLEAKQAKLKRKPKTVQTTQLDEFDLPFRSSQ